MIAVPSIRNNDAMARGMFSGTFAYIARKCDAAQPSTVKMWSPGNTGVFDTITHGFTDDRWPKQNFAGKTAHVGLHAIGSVAQAVAWVPLGVAGTLLSAALFACGFKGAAKVVIDHNTLACTAMLFAVDVAIDVTASVLFAFWITAKMARR